MVIIQKILLCGNLLSQKSWVLGLISLLSLFLHFGSLQTIISDCNSLQGIGSNLSASYFLNQSLDCTGYNFQIEGTFTGSLDGKGNTVSNLLMQNQTGLFSNGNGVIIQNIIFQNVVYGNSSSKSTTGIFSSCFSCTFYNITVTASVSFLSNVFTGLGVGSIAGVLGGAENNVTGCVVENTLINCISGQNPYGGGGLVGSTLVNTSLRMNHCYNLGFPGNSSQQIVMGQRALGGLIGSTNGPLFLSKSGVDSGVINSSYCIAGGAVALIQANVTATLSEVYVSENVTLALYNNSHDAGGLVGEIYFQENCNHDISITNCYSKATVLAIGLSRVSCLIGEFSFNNNSINNSISFQNVYSSCKIQASSYVSLITTIPSDRSNFFNFTNVFCSNVSSPNVSALIGNSSVNFPIVLNCSQLWNEVMYGFDQRIWNGDRLRIEYNGEFGKCSCISGCICPTTYLSTTEMPTLFSSTLSPTTTFSTTHSPTTPFPATPLPTTSFPATSLSTTFMSSLPSSAPTVIPTTSSASTFSTSTSPVCPFQVLDCHFCSPQAPLFDLTQGNVSCVFSQNGWRWTFTPNNGTFINNGEIILSGNTTLVQGNFENNANLNISSGSSFVILGNLTQSSGGQIVFTFNPSSSNSSSNNSSPLDVGGCVSINGNISLNLETQPQQGTTNLQLISYNCSQQVNISSSQIQVIPNYNGSSCDTIESQTINQQENLGIYLTSTIGNKCNGGKNLGLIIGLSVGIPCVLIVTVFVIISVLKMKQKTEIKAVQKGLGGKKMKNAKENPNFSDGRGTKWQENQAVEMI